MWRGLGLGRLDVQLYQAPKLALPPSDNSLSYFENWVGGGSTRMYWAPTFLPQALLEARTPGFSLSCGKRVGHGAQDSWVPSQLWEQMQRDGV